MSTMILSNTHISMMVSWAVKRAFGKRSAYCLTYYYGKEHHDIDDSTADRIARILAEANVAAYNDTYNATPDNPEPTVDSVGFSYRPQVVASTSPVSYLKLLDCYEYQACSWTGFEDSEQQAILKAMRRYGIGVLPGYVDAKWKLEEADSSVPLEPATSMRALKRKVIAAISHT